MKTAIVLGSTGLVGQELVAQLIIDHNIEHIIAVTRRPVEFLSDKVTNEVVDFDHLDDFSSVFHGDMLFSCLGTTKKQAGSISAQRKVDLDYQYKVAEIAAQNSVTHYLLVSSSGANRESRNPYFQMKGALESKVRDLPFHRISIFQPSLLMGQRDYFRLGEAVSSWVLPFLCRLPWLRRYRPITGAEVAKKMWLVSQSVGASKTYQLDDVFPPSSHPAQ